MGQGLRAGTSAGSGARSGSRTRRPAGEEVVRNPWERPLHWARFRREGKAEAAPEALTLERLFEIYGEEVVPTKHRRTQYQNRATMRMFLDFLGRDRRPETLSWRDWGRFIRERRAGLEPKRGRGWHSLRRKFASDLIGLPLKVLCDLGGWKEARTVLRYYQHTDEVQLRTALDSRPRKVGV